MKKIWNILHLFIALARVAKNPKNTKTALAMAERLQNLGLLEAELEAVSKSPAAVEVIKSRKMMSQIDLHMLKAMPEGSLGHTYSTHMLSLGLDPEFYKTLEIKDDVSFVMMRLRQTHDLWHVTTGFDTSTPGELGLQAFMLAQTNTPLAPLLIGGRLFAVAIKDPQEVPLIIESVATGWRMGKKAKHLFPIDWEKYWQTPLAEFQQEYQVEALSH
jgi:ubiquinone biosynthesis protein COQ4